jgi:ubiquinone/menaquinone biosynthesis C-methylase UbiE
MVDNGKIIKEVITFYDQFSENWDNRYKKNKSTIHFLNKRLEIIRAFTSFRGNEKVLEIGCGTAFHLIALSNQYGSGVGVDYSEKMLSIANKNAQQKNLQNIKFVLDNVEKLSKLENNTFDVVFFVGLLEHLPKPIQMFKNCKRVLKPGGIVIGITPNKYSPWYSIIAPLLRGSVKHLPSDRFYSIREINQMLTEESFSKTSFKLWGFIPAGDFPDAFFRVLYTFEKIGEKTILNRLAGGIAFRAYKEF